MHMMKKGHVGNHPVKKIVFNYAFLLIILENFFFSFIVIAIYEKQKPCKMQLHRCLTLCSEKVVLKNFWN